MVLPDSTKLVFERICKLDPEYVIKILGYLMLKTNEDDMIQLAFSHESVLQLVINRAKSELGIGETILEPYLQFSPYESFPSTSSRVFHPQPYSDFGIPNAIQLLSLEDQLEPGMGMGMTRRNRRCEFPVKVCHYYNKGYCKHGSKCRYFHGRLNGNEENNNNYVVVRGRPLEKLEMEIVELLKSRGGIPISIASLPMIYYEKYGRNLQADGYLTESQRHGKPGFSLTKLLLNLNCISVLDRPHGQHSVILAEDAHKYMEFSENNARQIYLTFPAESTFTEQDVSDYFSKYGPVQDVRIPCQQSRMYGFVTFVYVETVKKILSTTSCHIVCGAQVLVKPYKEKSKLSDRKYNIEKSPLPACYIPNYIEGDIEPQQCVMPRVCDGSRVMMRRHLIDENDYQQQQQNSQFLLTSKNTPRLPYLGFSARNLAHSTEMRDFSSTEQFHDFLGSWTDHSAHVNDAVNDSTEGINLPDSPFASPVRTSLSTAL